MCVASLYFTYSTYFIPLSQIVLKTIAEGSGEAMLADLELKLMNIINANTTNNLTLS
jgi:hypothetical protein